MTHVLSFRLEAWEKETTWLVLERMMSSGAVMLTWSRWSGTQRTVSRSSWSRLSISPSWNWTTTTAAAREAPSPSCPPACHHHLRAPQPAPHQDCQCQLQHSRPPLQRRVSQAPTKITTVTTRNPGPGSSIWSQGKGDCPEMTSSVTISTSDKKWSDHPRNLSEWHCKVI